MSAIALTVLREAVKASCPAITQLEIAKDVMVNNEPINRAEGNIEQADLERANAENLDLALDILYRPENLQELTLSELKGAIAMQAAVVVSDGRWDAWSSLMLRELNKFNQFEDHDWFETRRYYCWAVKCLNPKAEAADKPYLIFAFSDSRTGNNYQFASMYASATPRGKPDDAHKLGRGEFAHALDKYQGGGKLPELKSGRELLHVALSYFGASEKLKPAEKKAMLKERVDYLKEVASKEAWADNPFSEWLGKVWKRFNLKIQTEVDASKKGLLRLTLRIVDKTGKPVTALEVSNMQIDSIGQTFNDVALVHNFYADTFFHHKALVWGKRIFNTKRYSIPFTVDVSDIKERGTYSDANLDKPLEINLYWKYASAPWQ